MNGTRTAISTALFNLLKNAYAWNLADQRLQVPDNLDQESQPAMFVMKSKENVTQRGGMDFAMPVYKLSYAVLITLMAGATPETTTAESQLDAILDAVDAALQSPRKGEPQTLGGLVTNCWIEGDIQIDTPVLFQQCSIWIPITVLVGM
jgi:hypothetical protein